jgi:hypothetical protein
MRTRDRPVEGPSRLAAVTPDSHLPSYIFTYVNYTKTLEIYTELTRLTLEG